MVPRSEGMGRAIATMVLLTALGTDRARDAQADVSVPVPLLGLQLDWKLTKRTVIQMFLRTLYIHYHDFAGGIGQKAVHYEWYPSRHFAIGGGIADYNIRIDRYKSGNYTARFNYDVRALELYLKLAF